MSGIGGGDGPPIGQNGLVLFVVLVGKIEQPIAVDLVILNDVEDMFGYESQESIGTGEFLPHTSTDEGDPL